jgi:hypothetical protein
VTPWFAGEELTGADIQMSFRVAGRRLARGAEPDAAKLMAFVERVHARPAICSGSMHGRVFLIATALAVASVSAVSCAVVLGLDGFDYSDAGARDASRDAGADSQEDASAMSDATTTSEAGADAGGNLLVNANFDQGSVFCGAAWQSVGNAMLSFSSVTYGDAGQSCLICGSGIQQAVMTPFEAGTYLAFGGYMTVGDGGSVTVAPTLSGTTADGGQASLGFAVATLDGGWSNVPGMAMVTVDVTGVALDFYNQMQTGCFLLSNPYLVVQ